jgi:hypothetical protein
MFPSGVFLKAALNVLCGQKTFLFDSLLHLHVFCCLRFIVLRRVHMKIDAAASLLSLPSLSDPEYHNGGLVPRFCP